MIALDSGSFMALVKAEDGASAMRKLLREHSGQTFIHAANLLEIYYGIQREFGTHRAERVWLLMANKLVRVVEDMDRTFLRDAAFVKNAHKMSFADSFAVALARRLDCELVSTDHHELDAVATAGVCKVHFIR